MAMEPTREMASISPCLPNPGVHHFQRWTGRFIQLPADCSIVLVHRELPRGGTLLPRLPAEEDRISRQQGLDCQFTPLRSLSSLADPSDMAAGWPGAGNRLTDAASQRLIPSDCFSLLYKHVVDVRRLSLGATSTFGEVRQS